MLASRIHSMWLFGNFAITLFLHLFKYTQSPQTPLILFPQAVIPPPHNLSTLNLFPLSMSLHKGICFSLESFRFHIQVHSPSHHCKIRFEEDGIYGACNLYEDISLPYIQSLSKS
jgi:hypothetical protein